MTETQKRFLTEYLGECWNTYTSNSTLCCHWCKIPLGNATQVTYLNGNLPICDLCLSKQIQHTNNAKMVSTSKGVMYYERVL